MLQGFWGGVIVSVVNQLVVFLVLGGLACSIVLVRKLVGLIERRTRAASPPAAPARPAPPRPPSAAPAAPALAAPSAPIAAIAAAVHEFTGAAPGTLRIVSVTPLGAAVSAWKTAARWEGLRTENAHPNGKH
jgi:hypothetical protein